jgi:hypothetical protein
MSVYPKRFWNLPGLLSRSPETLVLGLRRSECETNHSRPSSTTFSLFFHRIVLKHWRNVTLWDKCWIARMHRAVAGLHSPHHYLWLGEPGSSVSIVSGYGLDDRTIEVRSPAEAKDFPSSLCVQTGSGAHPASCTMGTGGPFPGAKARPGRDADHSPPTDAEVENE